MQFRLFGELAATGQRGEVKLGAGRPGAVLSMLLLAPGELIPVDRLATDLFGDDQPTDGLHAIRVYVSRLRAKLTEASAGDVAVIGRSGGYVAEVPRTAVDVARFEDLVGGARTAVSDEKRHRLAGDALTLWSADPLAEYPYADFALRARRHLTELRLDAAEIWAEAALSLGQSADIISPLSALAGEHPYREQLWADLAKGSQRFRNVLDVEPNGLAHDCAPALRRTPWPNPGR